MNSISESSLLSKLESSTDISEVHALFFNYLQPFKTVSAPKKPSSKSSKPTETATTRSLAKQFISFLNKSLSLLPKRLSSEAGSSCPNNISTDGALKLFEVYRLCLNCTSVVLPVLDCKLYEVQLHQVRLIHCLENWNLYQEAQTECFVALESLRCIAEDKVRKKAAQLKRQLLPRLNEENVDQGFALLLVEIVITLVKCASVIQSKDEADYNKVIALVHESKPWCKVLNGSSYEKLHRTLVGYLNRICLHLAKALEFFDLELVLEFCELTFSLIGESSLKDQICKYAWGVCHCLFSKNSSEVLHTTDLLKFVLSFLAAACEFKVEQNITEFLEVVHNCARSCKTARPMVCIAVGEHLSKLAGSQATPLVAAIMGVYASGLLINSSECQSIIGECSTERYAKNGSISGAVLSSAVLVKNLHGYLESMRGFFNFSDQGDRLSKEITSYLLPYYNALKFFCHPVAKSVYAQRREILTEEKNAESFANLGVIHGAFNQFCSIFIHFTRTVEKINVPVEFASDGNFKVFHDVSIAAFTLSLQIGNRIKESANLVKYVLSSDWVQADGLKHIFSSLYNVYVVLYRNKQLEKASKALKLSCLASWNLLVLYCKSHELTGDLPEVSYEAFREDAIGYVKEASEKTAFLLDLLSAKSDHKVKRLLKSSLESWCVAESMLQNISPPFALVIRWVKIGHKLRQNKNSEHSSITLYNLLSSSDIVSRKALGVLMEQELLAYKSVGVLDSIFSRKMRMEIIEILLEKLYGSNDTCVEKSRVLIAKGGELRELGSENLDQCIQCLSEAISVLETRSSNRKSDDIQALHLRACAYCLRALCTQEKTMQNSKVLLLKSNFEDIRSALKLWFHPLQGHSTDQCSTLDGIFKFFNDNGHSNMFFENMLKMLHCLLDLLSIKGYTEMHAEIYEIIVRLFKWKNLSPEEALALFWKSRSFGHGLCASPFSEVVFSILSHCYGEQSKSIRFWIKSMQSSQALLIGFQQRFFSSLPDSFKKVFYEDVKVTHIEVRSNTSGSSFHVSIKDVKHVVSDLLSTVPVSGNALFLSAYLYYDLGDRLIMKGKVNEALFYSKEACQWRLDLLRQKFKYSVSEMSESNHETEDGTQRHCNILASIQLRDSVAKEVWFGCPPCDIECCILTPWNILQCYLDSIQQVSKIHEILGEASEAEALLHWGKQIALHHCLPVYVISFSSMLGKLYRKQMLWQLAERELKAASQIMADNDNMITCLKCKMFLESTICHQLGDLYKNHSCNNIENPSSTVKNYRSALHKLNIIEWDDFSSKFEDGNPEQFEDGDRSLFFGCSRYTLAKVALPSKSERPAGKSQKKKAQKKGKRPSPPNEKCLVAGHNLRMTRSRYRSLEKSRDGVSQNMECGPMVNSHNGNSCSCNREPHSIDLASEAETSIAEYAYEITQLSNKIKCWHCLVLEALKSGSMTDFVHLNWELVRRRVSWQLLIKIGKSFGAYDYNHKAHQIVLLSLSLLFNPFCGKYSSVSWTSLIEMLNEEFLQDILAVEHAVLLYSICWIALQSYSDRITRENHCQISTIGIPRIFSWLKLAFTLCCEVPILSQKVSRLLSVIYLLSTSVKAFSLSSVEALSENYWASFFHQASIGIYFNQQVVSSMLRKTKWGDMMNLEDCCLSRSDSGFLEALNSLRLTPEALSDMGEFVSRFFEGLPSSTIICVSVIGGAEAILLRELLSCASARAWILISRLNSKDQPIILLRPVDSVLEGGSIVDWDSISGISMEGKDFVNQWKCPWGSSIVDEIAPVFKTILEKNFLSSAFQTEDKLLWWSQRKSLDKCLGRFLQSLEDSWLGPWKFLLLDKCEDTNHMVSFEKKLTEDLMLMCKVKVNKDLLKVILRGASCSSEIRECALQLILNKGCYIGGCCGAVSNASVEVKGMSIEVFKIVSRTDALKEIESPAPTPVILVLDSEVQMLPWESLPILKDEEVYRMPSVSSICATLDRCRDHQQQLKCAEIFPVIDPLDSFYVLNPSGDLSETQFEFEKWFIDQKIEGKSGTAPTCEEMIKALEIHDLFIYIGHGSGSQYIAGHKIENLSSCAASLLMGCSSGCLSLDGHYAPIGTPLSYLLAGSPVIVANLWDVTDKDIDRFGKAMLDAWLKERSAVSARCNECHELLDKFRSLQIRGNRKEKGSKNNSSSESSDSFIVVSNTCKHTHKLGSFMGQARKACNLPHLIGAAPVCYGVPTGIAKKERVVTLTP